MWVHPSQLVPGCLILTDVKGKTSRPIVPEGTIVDEKHIEVLLHFLVQKVEVSEKLSNGSLFQPEEPVKSADEENNGTNTDHSKEKLSFEALYFKKVEQYKGLFISWQNGVPIRLAEVKQVIIPLLLRSDEIGLHLYTLPYYSTKKDYFYHHGIVTALLAAFLAKQSGYARGWIQVGLAGFLADAGMCKVDKDVFLKTERLTAGDYQEIKKHPAYSYRMIENIDGLSRAVKLGILQHHERLDGTGYPLEIKEEKIHTYARFIAVADTYHAMTSERYYQSKRSVFKVIEEMVYEQFGKFDPRIVEIFVKNLTDFSVGAKVRLSNGQLAEIIFIEERYPTRPLVRLRENNQIVSLKEHKSLFIEEVLR